MKKSLFYLLFTCSLLANDPTQLKGALKEILASPVKSVKRSKEKTQTKRPETKEVQEAPEDFQEAIHQLVFKAFYAKDSIKRLMVSLEDKIIFLEVQNQVVLNGDSYILKRINENDALFIHLDSQTLLTYTYRP